jgi:hypothetical protein
MDKIPLPALPGTSSAWPYLLGPLAPLLGMTGIGVLGYLYGKGRLNFKRKNMTRMEKALGQIVVLLWSKVEELEANVADLEKRPLLSEYKVIASQRDDALAREEKLKEKLAAYETAAQSGVLPKPAKQKRKV